MTTVLPGSLIVALLAGVAVALVAAFLVKPTRRIVPVPSLMVLRACLPDALVERGIRRWPIRIVGLLVALLTGWLLVAAAADPTWPPREPPPGLVFVLDASPSMQARVAVDGSDMGSLTRFDRAIQATRRAILASSGERLLVGLGGDRFVPLGAWQNDPDGALAMLHGATPGAEAMDAATVLADARGLLGPRGGRVVLVSDMAFELPQNGDGSLAFEGLSVGESAANVTLADFVARMAPGRRTLATALVRVAAFGTEASGKVVLESAPAQSDAWSLVAALPFRVVTGQPEEIRFDRLPIEGPRLRARLVVDCPSDACNHLVLDDSAELFLAAARPLRVTVAGRKNVFLESALAVQPGVVVRNVARPDLVQPRDTDLLIVNDLSGRVLDGVTALLIRPQAGNGRFEPLSSQRAPEFAPVAEADLLANNLMMDHVNVETAVFLRSELADRTVFASRRGMPLVIRRDRPDARTVAVAFGLDATDLGLRYAWPVLLTNVLAWAGGDSESFAAAPRNVADADRDLSPRAPFSPFEDEALGSHTSHPLIDRLGFMAAFLLACLAGIALLVEWALAQRRPDLGV